MTIARHLREVGSALNLIALYGTCMVLLIFVCGPLIALGIILRFMATAVLFTSAAVLTFVRWLRTGK